MTPTARSLEVLREMGYTAEVVERWVPRTRIRRDFAGFADILAFQFPWGILAIQATTGSNAAAREKKARAEPRLALWLRAGGKAEVWSWAKKGPRGKRKLWTLTRRDLAGAGP